MPSYPRYDNQTRQTSSGGQSAFHGDSDRKRAALEALIEAAKDRRLCPGFALGPHYVGECGACFGEDASTLSGLSTYLGIPEWLAVVYLMLFDVSSEAEAFNVAYQFITALPVGVAFPSSPLDYIAKLLKSRLESFEGKSYMVPDIELMARKTAEHLSARQTDNPTKIKDEKSSVWGSICEIGTLVQSKKWIRNLPLPIKERWLNTVVASRVLAYAYEADIVLFINNLIQLGVKRLSPLHYYGRLWFLGEEHAVPLNQLHVEVIYACSAEDRDDIVTALHSRTVEWIRSLWPADLPYVQITTPTIVPKDRVNVRQGSFSADSILSKLPNASLNRAADVLKRTLATTAMLVTATSFFLVLDAVALAKLGWWHFGAISFVAVLTCICRALGSGEGWSKVLSKRKGFVLLLHAYDDELLPDLDSMRLTAEESLGIALSSFGPVVSVMRPGKRILAPGQAQIRLENEHWLHDVTVLAKAAELVVVMPGHSTGVRRELDMIRDTISPERVLVYVPDAKRSRQRIDQPDLSSYLPPWVPGWAFIIESPWQDTEKGFLTTYQALVRLIWFGPGWQCRPLRRYRVGPYTAPDRRLAGLVEELRPVRSFFGVGGHRINVEVIILQAIGLCLALWVGWHWRVIELVLKPFTPQK